MTIRKLRKEVFDKLIRTNMTITFAESITGGLLASTLVKNNGASKVFKHYIIEAKERLIGGELKDRPVSFRTAHQMAIGLVNKYKENISVAVTGNAFIPKDQINSPDRLEAYICIIANKTVYRHKVEFNGNNRNKNIRKTVKAVYHYLNEAVSFQFVRRFIEIENELEELEGIFKELIRMHEYGVGPEIDQVANEITNVKLRINELREEEALMRNKRR